MCPQVTNQGGFVQRSVRAEVTRVVVSSSLQMTSRVLLQGTTIFEFNSAHFACQVIWVIILCDRWWRSFEGTILSRCNFFFSHTSLSVIWWTRSFIVFLGNIFTLFFIRTRLKRWRSRWHLLQVISRFSHWDNWLNVCQVCFTDIYFGIRLLVGEIDWSITWIICWDLWWWLCMNEVRGIIKRKGWRISRNLRSIFFQVQSQKPFLFSCMQL